MTKELSPSHKKILKALRISRLSPQELAEETGLSYDGVRGRVAELRSWFNFDIQTVDDGYGTKVYKLNENDNVFQSSKRQYMNETLRKKIRSVIDETLSLRNDVERTAFCGADYVPDGETCVLETSDWHLGKKVEDEYGDEIYNIRIAKHRLDDLTDNVYKLANVVKRGTEIDEVIIADVGDIVDGEMIYETQHSHIEMNIAKQVEIATKEKWKQIKLLRNVFQCPIRYISVYGNHGSLGRGKFSEASNFDNIVNMMLGVVKDESGYDDVLIDNSYNEIAVRNVRGNKMFMKHKCPKQTETAAARARWNGWITMYDYDIALTGHWHHWAVNSFQGRPIIYNGSIVGEDMLSRRLALQSDCSQMMFGISDNHVPSFMYSIQV